MNLIASLAARMLGAMTVAQKKRVIQGALRAHVSARKVFLFSRRDGFSLSPSGLDCSTADYRQTTPATIYEFQSGKQYDPRSPSAAGATTRRRELSSEENISSDIRRLIKYYPDIVENISISESSIDLTLRNVTRNRDSATLSYLVLNDLFTSIVSAYLLAARDIEAQPIAGKPLSLRLPISRRADPAAARAALNGIADLCDALRRRDCYQLVHHLVGSPDGRKRSSKTFSTGLASGKRTSFPQASVTQGEKFVFLVHYTAEGEYVDMDPSFEQFSDKELQNWKAWIKAMGPGFVHHIEGLTSAAGHGTEGWLIALPMLPRDMLKMGRRRMLPMLENAMRLAGGRGVSRVGLGAFTSIVSRGGEALTGKGMDITSGSTLTTLMALAGIDDVAARLGADLTRSRAVVVGATGAIGRLAALLLARRVGALTLVGNPSNPNALDSCAAVIQEIAMSVRQAARPEGGGAVEGALARRLRALSAGHGGEAAAPPPSDLAPCLRATVDLAAALRDADIVLVATNSDAAVIRGDDLKDGAIVCDVARPPNVAGDIMRRRDVLAFDGGLVALPEPINLGPNQGFPPGVCWGCLGETILLALEGETGDYSIGQTIPLAEADHLARLAAKHGFRAAPAQWHGRKLGDADFGRVKVDARIAVSLAATGDKRVA